MIPVSDAFRYALRPHFVERREQMDVASITHIVALLLVTLLLGIVSSAFVGGIIMSVLGDLPENVNGTLAETDARQLILIGILIAPIMEELIFRSWLGLPRSSVLGFPVMVIVLTLLTAASLGFGINLTLPLGVGFLVLMVALIRRFYQLTPQEQIAARARLFPYAFWGTLVVFAFIHLSNYEGGVAAAFAAPVMFLAVVPQIIAGAMLGYVRMRFGLIQAIVFHMIYNAVLIALAVTSINLAAPESGADTLSYNGLENTPVSSVALLRSGLPLP